MTAGRYLIVNADDFGQSPGVNRGIIQAHRQGIVTSASLMVRWSAAPEAARYSRDHPSLSVGLHVDLGEWAYRDGTWVPLYEVVDMGDTAAVSREVGCQLSAFRRLVGKDPTHVDSHQHVHQRESVVCDALVELAQELAVPLRHFSPHVRYCGDFYGQTPEGFPLPNSITAEALIHILMELPPGITELACHPGEGDDLNTMYRAERAWEVAVLCEPRVRTALNASGIELHSFANLSAGSSPRQRG